MLMVMVLVGFGTIAEYGGEEVKSAGSGGRKIACSSDRRSPSVGTSEESSYRC